MQFGPTIRMPGGAHQVHQPVCTTRPSPDTSAKPAEMTTTPRTPTAAHSATASSTAGAGTQ